MSRKKTYLSIFHDRNREIRCLGGEPRLLQQTTRQSQFSCPYNQEACIYTYKSKMCMCECEALELLGT